jgi:hypothetical protein
LQGKTQLVKGKLQGLGEEQAALSISLNYFTDVASFQKARKLYCAQCAFSGAVHC